MPVLGAGGDGSGDTLRMAARTILVTGSTDGLGLAAARVLAAEGHTLLLHGRDRGRLDAALQEVGAAATGEPPDGFLADLSSLAAVRRLAAELEDEPIDVLVNNAGIGPGPPDVVRDESADGIELRFAVNYVAPFLLTLLLLPGLRRPARIVNVASAGQAPIDFDDPLLERGYDRMQAYRQSKLAQILFTFELQSRLREAGDDKVTVTALHPASLMSTKMVYEGFGEAWTGLEEGTAALVRLASASGLDGVGGVYFDGQYETRADAQAYDEDARRRLWELSEELAGATWRTRSPGSPGSL